MVDIYYLKIDFTDLPKFRLVNRFTSSNYNFTNWTTEEINLVYFEEGVSEFTVSNGFKFTVHPGDVIVTAPGLSYSWKTEDSVFHSHTGLFITNNIKFEILEENKVFAYKSLFDTEKINVMENGFVILPFHYIPPVGLDLGKKMNSMYMEFNNNNICSSLILAGLFFDITTTITRMCITKPLYTREADYKPAYNYIYSNKIIEYLNENYKSNLDINILANSLNLNPDYMRNIFRKTTNYTLINYLNKLRINKAKEMMLYSNCKINVICKEVGIEDEYYFSKLFKKHEGITPKQYRSSILFSNDSP